MERRGIANASSRGGRRHSFRTTFSRPKVQGTIHFLFFIGYYYYAITDIIHLRHAVCGQTNLFRGYQSSNKNKDYRGIIEDVPLTVELSNGMTLPLIGMGVGNMQRDQVETMIHHAINDDRRIRLFDTSNKSGNERECGRGVKSGVTNLKEKWLLSGTGRSKYSKDGSSSDKVQVHVVTKVWYTHLGYSRTKLAVDEILENFKDAIDDPYVDLRLTILIHWQRCYDNIPWMHCLEEEQQLPEKTKNTGPPPHLDENAWKESWRALEDMYGENENDDRYSVIAAIGISHFDYEHVHDLLQISNIKPHIIQINVWSLKNEPAFIELLKNNNIHIQVYNTMNGIVAQVFSNPKAHHHILMLAAQLERKAVHSISSTMDEIIEKLFTSQVVLKWLVQQNISVVPRTSDLIHLSENSAKRISRIPNMSEQEMIIAEKAIMALINKEDLEEDVLIEVRFHAKESDMFLYWVSEDKNEKHVSFVEMGGSFSEHTHPGHKYKVYHAYDPDKFKVYSIVGRYGDEQDIHVEL